MSNTIKVIYAKTFKDKIKGLIGAEKPYPLYFQTRFGIHTFGLRFPIDVIILDRSNKIVDLKQDLKPNSFFFWNPKYNTVIELPKGTIAKQKMTKGAKVTCLR